MCRCTAAGEPLHQDLEGCRQRVPNQRHSQDRVTTGCDASKLDGAAGPAAVQGQPQDLEQSAPSAGGDGQALVDASHSPARCWYAMSVDAGSLASCRCSRSPLMHQTQRPPRTTPRCSCKPSEPKAYCSAISMHSRSRSSKSGIASNVRAGVQDGSE